MTETEITLPPDLVERVLKLTPEQQDELVELMYQAMDTSIIIEERADRVANVAICDEARKHGLELRKG
jgi:hypothetical protein